MTSPRRRRRNQQVPVLTVDVWVHYVVGYLSPSDMLKLGRVSKAFVDISYNIDYWDTVIEEEVPGDSRTWYWSRQRVMRSLKSLRGARGLIQQTKATSLIELKSKQKSQPFTMAVLSTNGRLLIHNSGSKILKIGGTVSMNEDLLPPTECPPTPKSTASQNDDDVVYQPTYSYLHKKEGILAVACSDRTIKLIDACTVEKRSYTVLKHIKAKPKQGHSAQITGIGMDSRAVYTSSFDKTARVWSRRTGQTLFRVLHPDVVTSLKVQDGEGGLFCSHSIGSHSGGVSVVKLHDAAAGRTIIDNLAVSAIPSAVGHGAQQAVLCGLTDNGTILWTSMKYAVVPFDLRTGNHIGVVSTGLGAGSAFHMAEGSSSSGGMVYVGGSESAPGISGCDTRMMKRVFQVENAHDKVITCLAADTFNGTPHLFSASRDGTVRIWDTLSGSRVACLFEHTNRGGIHNMTWNGLQLLTLRNQSVQVLDFTRYASPLFKLVVA